MLAPSRWTRHALRDAKRTSTQTRQKKTAVVGIKDREAGINWATAVLDTTAAQLVAFVKSNIAMKARVLTYENQAYGGLENHETVNRGEMHVNGREPFWVLVRRGYNGTFCHIEPKHLYRYINEFAERLSMKTLGVVDKMRMIVWSAMGKRPTYRHLVVPSTLCDRP